MFGLRYICSFLEVDFKKKKFLTQRRHRVTRVVWIFFFITPNQIKLILEKDTVKHSMIF